MSFAKLWCENYGETQWERKYPLPVSSTKRYFKMQSVHGTSIYCMMLSAQYKPQQIQPSAKCADIQQSLKATQCRVIWTNISSGTNCHLSSNKIVCDMLARQAVTLAMMQGYHDRPTQLLPKEDIAVVIWGNKITDDVSSPIRFHASKEVAR